MSRRAFTATAQWFLRAAAAVLLFPAWTGAHGASAGEASCGAFDCPPFAVDLHDVEAMQRGARLYVNYCFGCHSLRHARHERNADDLGVPHDLALEYLVPDGSKIGDRILSAMDPELAAGWFGASPPDLTLVARERSPAWLYAFLRSFYAGPERSTGVNNRVFPNVAMPHVLYEMQGLQRCAPGPGLAPNGGVLRDPTSGEDILNVPCGRFELAEAGRLSPEDFDHAISDLVHFLAYVGEPTALERQRIGVYAMLFLVVLLVFTWLLKREYWKDVDGH